MADEEIQAESRDQYPWIDGIFSDAHIFFWIISIIPLAHVVRLFIADEFGFPQLIAGISQGLLVGMATTVAILSYRYSVRSNLRDTIQSLETIEIDNYRIEVTLHAVRWRPPIGISYFHEAEAPPSSRLSKLGLKLRPRTAIQIHVYDVSEGQRIAPEGAEVLEDMGIPLSELSDSGASVLDENLQIPLDLEFYSVSKIENGLHFSFLSTEDNEIKKAIQSILILLSNEESHHISLSSRRSVEPE
ncbi:hypothetical protein [Halostella sp. PRR32]|uniref:hypothetical protein n=1 Tax=Halostella sp. PRR32 TaxID=3098147 RepID=UPI002B1D2BAF|nr:hypothetical protein [Halostella sp. PRR32]